MGTGEEALLLFSIEATLHFLHRVVGLRLHYVGRGQVSLRELGSVAAVERLSFELVKGFLLPGAPIWSSLRWELLLMI